MFTFPEEYLTDFDFNVLKEVMFYDSANTIASLMDHTISEIQENFSLAALWQGHKDMFQEFHCKLSLNSSKYVIQLFLSLIYKIQHNL